MNIYNPPVTDNNLYRLHLNENLYGPSPKCTIALNNINTDDICKYDLKADDLLTDMLADKNHVKTSNVLLQNGAADMIQTIFHAYLNDKDKILLPNPSWQFYTSAANQNNLTCDYFKLTERETTFSLDLESMIKNIVISDYKLIIIASPNMPTGNSISEKDIEFIASYFKSSIVVIDQVYYEFSDVEINIEKIIENHSNVIFLRTFSKYYALANMRIGYCISNESTCNILKQQLPLFKISYVSRLMAIEALNDIEYYETIKNKIKNTRDYIISEINKMGKIRAYLSDSNFIYVNTGNFNANSIKSFMAEHGYNIRQFSDDKYLRISIGEEDKMNEFIEYLQRYFCK